MTAQIAERLLYQGEMLSMCTNPLNDYFSMGGDTPRFASNCTALWRGYVGDWEIIDSRLYLVGLRGSLEDGSEATLATVFPEFPRRVFAHWYSGTLRIPQGRRLEYVHMGYSSKYERDLILEIKKGVVVAAHLRHNGAAEEDAPQGYGVQAMTVFPINEKNSSDRGQS